MSKEEKWYKKVEKYYFKGVMVWFWVFLIGLPSLIIWMWFDPVSATEIIGNVVEMPDLTENQIGDEIGKTIRVNIEDGISTGDSLK